MRRHALRGERAVARGQRGIGLHQFLVERARNSVSTGVRDSLSENEPSAGVTLSELQVFSRGISSGTRAGEYRPVLTAVCAHLG